MDPTARNSDCQFWSVVCQKSAEPRYPTQERDDCSCSRRSELYSLQPATDCANQDQSQIVAITMTSELEYNASRRPRTLAQLGESCLACSPTSCSSSDSPPSWPTSWDRGEPFWTSHTVRRMNSVNWRYSDCQFSVTACAKLEVVR